MRPLFKLKRIFFCSTTILLSLAANDVIADSIKPNHKVKSYLNVRLQPKVQSPSIGILKPHQTAELIKSTPSWHHIKLASGVSGYVSGGWSVVIKDTNKSAEKTNLVDKKPKSGRIPKKKGHEKETMSRDDIKP
jgi:hypothetical protein